MKIKRRLVYLWNKWIDYWIIIKDEICKIFLGCPKIMTIEDTIDYLHDNHWSVCRYGDGEFKLICGQRILFQEKNDKLAERLREILEKYNRGEAGNCLVCLPDMFEHLDRYGEEHKHYIQRIVALNRKQWYSVLNKKKVYGNAFISRLYQVWIDKSKCGYHFNKMKHLWDGREVVFVEGVKTRLGYGNDLFSNTAGIKRILCPQMNAYEMYDEILESICQFVKKDKLIILALGPTATVLAYDLAMLGYQALDLGHIDIEYEWYRMSAKKKVKVQNKFISESPGGMEVEDLQDPEYLNQILVLIGQKC